MKIIVICSLGAKKSENQYLWFLPFLNYMLEVSEDEDEYFYPKKIYFFSI